MKQKGGLKKNLKKLRQNSWQQVKHAKLYSGLLKTEEMRTLGSPGLSEEAIFAIRLGKETRADSKNNNNASSQHTTNEQSRGR